MLVKRCKKAHTQEQLLSGMEKEERVIGESYYPIKLDMEAIKNLKSAAYSEYMEIGANYQITVFEEELNNIVMRHFNSQNNLSAN